MKISGSVAIVTGGASGLGRATVRELVARGARVAALDVLAPLGDRDPADDSAVFQRCDVTDTDEVAQAFDAITAAFGRLDLCVNCAGIHLPERLISRSGALLDLSALRQTLEVNVIGVTDMMRRSAQMMLKNDPGDDGERGVIINVGSIAALEGPIGSISYSGSKGAIMAMTLPVARELGPYGVRVLCIAPGSMETPMIGGIDDTVRDQLVHEQAFPLRLGRPSEFASLVCTIAETAFLNATTIRLDGGARMGPKLPARRPPHRDRG